MNILQTPTFGKQVKKLHKNQKNDLDQAVGSIVENPYVGDTKKGDLSDIRVYKFKMNNQLILLAYMFNEDERQLVLVSLGAHENFYRDLKR